MRRHGRLLVLLAVALGACDDGSTQYVGAHYPKSQGGAPGDAAVLDCPLEGGEAQYMSLKSGGTERRFFVSVPADYDPDRAYPVVFALHARDENGSWLRGELDLEVAAPDDWGLFVYPDGLEREWTDESVATGWQNGPATTYYGGTEDLEFMRDAVAYLQSELCVRIERLFATGRWWGGEFTSVLGCYAGDLFDAIVTVHCNTPYYLPLEPQSEPTCVGDVAVWNMHGRGDEDFPIEYGTDQLDFWLRRHDCATDSATPLELPGMSTDDDCVEYACNGRSTRFCAVADSQNYWVPSYYAAAAFEFFAGLQ